MNFDRLKYIPFLFWIAFFAIGVGATLSNPRREGSGFKGIRPNIAKAGETHGLKSSTSTVINK
jgi:hypothetical protein